MDIESWLKQAKWQIDALDAELIALECFVGGETGADRSWLVSHNVVKITTEMQEKADEMVKKRQQGVPLAYILGKKEFYGRDFYVDERVLIPRPETEALVNLALEATRGLLGDFGGKMGSDSANGIKAAKSASEGRKMRILEVGTGSGCIAVTLAQESLEVMAVDVSEAALEVARRNNERYGGRVRMWQGDLLENVAPAEQGEVIVANLPYVDRRWDWLDRRSLGHEPELALYADEAGLALYLKLFEQLNERQAAGVVSRYLIVEADLCQHERLIELGEQYGWQLVKKEGYGLAFRNVQLGAI